MRAEVVGVGTELLLGDIVNTNAAFIGRALAGIGIDCHFHTVVGDNEERIVGVLATALARADAAILTGGIGPTQDDITREAIVRCTGRALVRDPVIEERLRARFRRFGRPMPEMNLRQADVPEGATVIEERSGTAPGLIVEHGAGVIYALPGVPHEMEEMLARAVLPDLVRRAGPSARIVSRVVRTAGMAESAVAEAIAPVWDRGGGDVTVAFLAGGGEVRVRLTAKAADEERAAALLDAAEKEVREVLGPAVVGTDAQTIEAVVGELLRARGWTLGCAESLTGGELGARITAVPGASDYFRGSIVAYANEVKERVLGVPDALLAAEGPVSAPVALAMAAGARAALGAEVGVALTGIAGPAEQAGPTGKRWPVGTVFVAVSGPLGETHRELRLPPGRAAVRSMSVGAALNLVRLYLLENLG